MKQKIYRQGDVLFVAINAVPEGAKKKNNVLAKGEHTGHYHAAMTPAVVSELAGMQYIDAAEDFVLEHQEHENLTIPAGMYEVRIQRELDLLGEIRRVLD